jgi:hypothetical protein
LRYEIALSAVARKEPAGDPLPANSRDISSKGIGLVFGEQLHPGDIVEVSFIIPDSGEQVTAKGTVVWACAIGPDKCAVGPNRYRIGLALTGHELNPVSLVLRSIRVRTSRYHD